MNVTIFGKKIVRYIQGIVLQNETRRQINGLGQEPWTQQDDQTQSKEKRII